jgi:hypothetical protein
MRAVHHRDTEVQNTEELPKRNFQSLKKPLETEVSEKTVSPKTVSPKTVSEKTSVVNSSREPENQKGRSGSLT